MLNYFFQIIIVEYLWTSVSRARCLCGSDFLFLKTGTTAWRYNNNNNFICIAVYTKALYRYTIKKENN